MPQMMPMFWMIMLSFTINILLIIITLIHFLNLPTIQSLSTIQNSSQFYNWPWTW